jgi:hypothetical protein
VEGKATIFAHKITIHLTSTFPQVMEDFERKKMRANIGNNEI